jgi:hypothetical protein
MPHYYSPGPGPAFGAALTMTLFRLHTASAAAMIEGPEKGPSQINRKYNLLCPEWH